jgi:dimeric dUTPase (all-alpha-NTP-PPase superfamily)
MIILDELFAVQKVLRDRIGYDEPDRPYKLILALITEIGECANEQRSWKFWSKDQKPRTRKARTPYMDIEDAEFYNPLLEEYVDGLHFVLEQGLEIGQESFVFDANHSFKYFDIERQFILVTWFATQMMEDDFYNQLVHSYIELGLMLGFTWEEIEQAYFAKNKINHVRQETGY